MVVNLCARRQSSNTHTLATLLNCSSRLRGKKVMMVYLDEMTWFVAYVCSFLMRPL